MKKILGTNTIGYNQNRNFAALPYEKYRFEKKQNLHKIPAFLYNKLTNKTHQYYWNSYRDFDLNKVELFHFFNALSYGNKPWITTFETSIPRWGDKNIEKGLELIASKACKKIIALSNCATNVQRMVVAKSFPHYIDVIEEKLITLHPAQVCPPIKDIEKTISDRLNFTIVGGDFFRKGGKEILIAFDRLYERGITDWNLNIVSRMEFGDYASRSTTKDLEIALQIIDKYPNNITYKKFLSNKEVLNLFKNTHIGLLPTYADTYGYSVLEAQSYGCPVITTNIRALPEINNSDLGWVINVKKDDMGNAILNTEKDIKTFSDNLINELEVLLYSIINNSESVINKGLKSYEKLEKSITYNTEFLEKIYDEITESN